MDRNRQGMAFCAEEKEPIWCPGKSRMAQDIACPGRWLRQMRLQSLLGSGYEEQRDVWKWSGKDPLWLRGRKGWRQPLILGFGQVVICCGLDKTIKLLVPWECFFFSFPDHFSQIISGSVPTTPKLSGLKHLSTCSQLCLWGRCQQGQLISTPRGHQLGQLHWGWKIHCQDGLPHMVGQGCCPLSGSLTGASFLFQLASPCD